MEAEEARLNETGPRYRGNRRRRTQHGTAEVAEELHQDEQNDLPEGLAELSDDERFAIFESGVNQGVLPSLPRMPGYHVCWLTTVSLSDTIQRRQQLGYELVYDHMIPGWRGGMTSEGMEGKPDPYPGVVRVREMVAARIKITLYNRYMKHLHERMPLADEEKLRHRVDQMKDGMGKFGSRFEEEDGTANVVNRAAPMPDFTE